MKKNKHITINIDDDNYNLIYKLAKTENRNITNYVYLLIIKALEVIKYDTI